MSNVLKKIAVIALAAIACGCKTSKTRDVELNGMYASDTGTVAIGSIDIQAAPQGEEAVIFKYAEDSAWLSPSTKTCNYKLMLTGTNSVSNADVIISNIVWSIRSEAKPSSNEQ